VGERGQSSIELLGALPALLLVAGVVVQLLVIGYTKVLAGNAAEAGALAVARGVGGAAAAGGAERAARAAVPGWVRGGLQVTAGPGAVRVRMSAPALLPGVRGLLRVDATAAVAAPGRLPIVPGLPLP
jgi:hypothetical protein